MHTNDNRGWIVRCGDRYLCPKDGDVGYTSELAEAGTFCSEEEAMDAGREHCDSGFVVMRAPGVDDRLQDTLKAIADYIPEEHPTHGGVDTAELQNGVPLAASPSKEPLGITPYLALSKARRHLSGGNE